VNSFAAEAAEETLDYTEDAVDQSQHDKIQAVVIRFNQRPSLLSIGAFRPRHDVKGAALQRLDPNSAYVALHILAAEDKAVLAITWLRHQKAASRFAESFVAQPREHLTTLAIQTAFEYCEHTCMRRDWWLSLPERKRVGHLKRVERANSFGYVRLDKSISFQNRCDDWGCDSIHFVN
jgi:hypothetical protein